MPVQLGSYLQGTESHNIVSFFYHLSIDNSNIKLRVHVGVGEIGACLPDKAVLIVVNYVLCENLLVFPCKLDLGLRIADPLS